jgi:hypothetical protein
MHYEILPCGTGNYFPFTAGFTLVSILLSASYALSWRGRFIAIDGSWSIIKYEVIVTF